MAININIKFHKSQLEVWNSQKRHNILLMGRRWGKTTFAKSASILKLAENQNVGYFAPGIMRFVEPFYRDVSRTLSEVIKSHKSGTYLDFKPEWGCMHFFSALDENSGRSKRLGCAILDECAMSDALKVLPDLWQKSIKPTLIENNGQTWWLTTPTGRGSYFHDLYLEAQNDPDWGVFNLPTWDNPYVSEAEIRKEENRMHPLAFRQEFCAEFVDWNEASFYLWDYFKKVPDENLDYYDCLYYVVDTATKAGKNNDGTAIILVGGKYDYSAHGFCFVKNITIIDYDLVVVDAGMLDQVFKPLIDKILEKVNKKFMGMFIEAVGAGAVVYQTMRQIYGGFIKEINSKYLTHVSKGERALAASVYMCGENENERRVFFSQNVCDKQVLFHGRMENHFKTQIVNFNLSGGFQEDDCVDVLNYSALIAFKNGN